MRACHAAQNEGDQRVWERQHPNLDMGTLSNVIQPARESHDKVPERLTGTPRISYSTLASDKRLVFDRTGSNPVLVDFF